LRDRFAGGTRSSGLSDAVGLHDCIMALPASGPKRAGHGRGFGASRVRTRRRTTRNGRMDRLRTIRGVS
jgi:hypothetical protein